MALFIFNCGTFTISLKPPLITENWSRTSAPYLLASKRTIPRVAALSVCNVERACRTHLLGATLSLLYSDLFPTIGLEPIPASPAVLPIYTISRYISGHFILRRPHTAKHFPASLMREQGFCPSKPRKGTSKRFKGVYKVLVWRASEPEACHPDRPFRCASAFVVPVRASLVGWSYLLGKNHCFDIPPLLSIVGLSPIAGNIPRLAFILFCHEFFVSCPEARLVR